METPLIYVDAGIFIAAALNNGEEGKTARDLIFNQPIATSSLTFTEILGTVTKLAGREQAKWMCGKFLAASKLQILQTNAQTASFTFENFNTTPLNPRQAAHLACMQQHEITLIASKDPEFDKINGIKRVKI